MRITVIEAHCLDLDLVDRTDDLALVTAGEKDRAANFRAPIDARRFIARRAAIRRLLAQRTGRPPDRIVIAYGPFGRPYLPDSNVRFSVSHAGPLLLVAMANGLELGCDIEQKSPDRDLLAIARTCFTSNESAGVAALSGNERIARFYDCWTRKEAYLKAVGVGMSLPMNSFEFVRDASGTARLGNGGADWSSTSWTPAPGYRAAIVAPGDRWVLGRANTHFLAQRRPPARQ